MTAPTGARPSPPNQPAEKYTGGATSVTGAAVGQPTEAPIEEMSVGELVSNISRDMSTLMRQEMELAKVEIKAEVSKVGKGAGMLGGAGFAGYMVAVLLSFAAAWGLANVMDVGWAFLIVAVVWGVVAAVLFVIGRKTLKTVNPTPERTVETVKEIPDALKPGH